MKKTADDFLMKYGIPSDTTIGIEGDHKLTDLLEEYRSQASDLPSDGITKFTEKEIDAAKSVRDSFLNQAGVERYKQVYMAGEIVMSDQLQPILASHVARIKELEEDIHRINLLNKQYSDFRNEVLKINDEMITILDDKYFPF